MWIKRASRGRLVFPLSWREVAGTCAGLTTVGVGAGLEELVGLPCNVALLEAGASAGGVRGWVDGADSPVAEAAFGRGEAMMAKAVLNPDR
jgi:hypothetical protein